MVDVRPAPKNPLHPAESPEPNRNSVDLLGAFTQVSYSFAPGDPAAAKPAVLSLPRSRRPPLLRHYTGRASMPASRAAGTWGESKQIGQTVDRKTFDSTPDFDVDGGLVGGTLGYNSQFSGIWVLGVESDMSWVDARGSANQIPPFLVSQVATTKEDWLATTRARVGVTPVDRLLVYGTGGVAVADVAASITNANGTTAFRCRIPRPSGLDRRRRSRGGDHRQLVGQARISVCRMENHAYFVPTPDDRNITNRAGGVPLNNNIVRAGINYRFGSL